MSLSLKGTKGHIRTFQHQPAPCSQHIHTHTHTHTHTHIEETLLTILLQQILLRAHILHSKQRWCSWERTQCRGHHVPVLRPEKMAGDTLIWGRGRWAKTESPWFETGRNLSTVSVFSLPNLCYCSHSPGNQYPIWKTLRP